VKRVLLCQDIHPDGRRLLEGRVDVCVAPDADEQSARKLIGDCHAVIVRTATQITAATIDAGPLLEVIARTGAGVDNVDVKAATARGIPVCYAPFANCSSVVEHTLALMLTLAKNLHAMDLAVRQGRFDIRRQYNCNDVADKVLGLIGFGRIGRELARRCVGMLGMRVIVFDPYVKAEDVPDPVEVASKAGDVFQQADFVSIHVPLSDKTRHLVDAAMIGLMKPSAYLINTSRGAVVDESALAAALAAGEIAGAGLDVLETEPPKADNPLLGLSNVVLTPHTAALTQECAGRMATDAVKGVLAVLEGKRPEHVFNSQVYAPVEGTEAP